MARNQEVSVRFSKLEHERLWWLADKHGLKLSEYIREASNLSTRLPLKLIKGKLVLLNSNE